MADTRGIAYVLRDLGICYNLAVSRPKTLKSFAGEVIRGHLSGTMSRQFWAIRELSFVVRRGETLGIVGANGSGKSTLLMALAGIMGADEGSIGIGGRPSLMTLGAGFQRELTGRQNIFLSAAYMGFSHAQTAEVLDEIIDFTELGDFIDVPLRQYSAGMRARLGFSLVAHTDPDILLLDEVLSVGDVGFRDKSLAKMLELIERAGTIVIVGHDPGFLESFCTRIAWLHAGRLEALGEPTEVLDRYRASFVPELTAIEDAQ
jgi:ABC-type polysaccharide/polyol phosphate transport system ATPase subunit